MTPGVDAPILSPGGFVPFDSTVVIIAPPGKTIQFFAEPDFADFVQDPKSSSFGRTQAIESSTIVIDDPNTFAFTIKARIFDTSNILDLLGFRGVREFLRSA